MGFVETPKYLLFTSGGCSNTFWPLLMRTFVKTTTKCPASVVLQKLKPIEVRQKLQRTDYLTSELRLL